MVRTETDAEPSPPLQRLREKLTRLNVIGVSGDRMWWTGKALRAFPLTMPRPAAADEDDGDIPF